MMMMMIRKMFSLAMVVSTCTRTLSLVDAQGTQSTAFPMSEEVTNTCREMINSHTFEGTCCSLEDTTAGGCRLNVRNGRCKVRGEIWSLTFTSTYSIDPCRESVYKLTDPPTMAPSSPPTQMPAPTFSPMPTMEDSSAGSYIQNNNMRVAAIMYSLLGVATMMI